jgi:hypothetical protein
MGQSYSENAYGEIGVVTSRAHLEIVERRRTAHRVSKSANLLTSPAIAVIV